jgi:hypothetical protein
MAKLLSLARRRAETDAQITNKIRLAKAADTADAFVMLVLKAAAGQSAKQFHKRTTYAITRVASYVACELGTDAALDMLALAGAAIEEVRPR